MRHERISYGPGAAQFAHVRIPEDTVTRATAIVIHGGFWRAPYNLDYLTPFCEALANDGIATWNIEYRRIGDPGGGWPGTFDDVLQSADHLFSVTNANPKTVIAIGHSAGGHLALWLGGRNKLGGAVSLAGVADLFRAWELRLSNNVVTELLGGTPAEVPERYRFASPFEQLPLGIRQRLIHGTKDHSVPYEISSRYVSRAIEFGDDAELITLENSGHFELVNPKSTEFEIVREAVCRLL